MNKLKNQRFFLQRHQIQFKDEQEISPLNARQHSHPPNLAEPHNNLLFPGQQSDQSFHSLPNGTDSEDEDQWKEYYREMQIQQKLKEKLEFEFRLSQHYLTVREIQIIAFVQF